jgi:hypothetical protein
MGNQSEPRACRLANSPANALGKAPIKWSEGSDFSGEGVLRSDPLGKMIP